MWLSLQSDDLSIEAFDLWMNLLLEEPWAPWALPRFWSQLHIVQIRYHTLNTAWCTWWFAHLKVHWTLHITHWTLHCTLYVEHFYLDATSSRCKRSLYIEHWTLTSLYWTLNILICVQDQMFHTLDQRSNSNHITCCKFAQTNQRETQRGTWRESMALMSDWCDLKWDKWGPSGRRGWVDIKPNGNNPEEQKVNTVASGVRG